MHIVPSSAEQLSSQWFTQSVALAIAPFRAGRIFAEVGDDVRSRDYIVRVKCTGVNHEVTVKIDSWAMVEDPDGTFIKLYWNLYYAFLHRPTLPIDDHIILGEE